MKSTSPKLLLNRVRSTHLTHSPSIWVDDGAVCNLLCGTC